MEDCNHEEEETRRNGKSSPINSRIFTDPYFNSVGNTEPPSCGIPIRSQTEHKIRKAGDVLDLDSHSTFQSAFNNTPHVVSKKALLHDDNKSVFKRLSVELESYVLSDRIKTQIKEVNIEKAVLLIQKGSDLLKFCSKKLVSPHYRPFRVDMDFLSLRWISPVKSAAESQIYFSDVYRIVPGIDSDFWRGRPLEEAKRGIEILASIRSLRIICDDESTWELWFTGLMYVHQRALTRLEGETSLASTFIKQLWETADKNQDGFVQLQELRSLFKSLALSASPAHTEQLFLAAITDTTRYQTALTEIEESDAKNEGIEAPTLSESSSVGLTFDEFKVLIQRMYTHFDVLAYFEHYIDSDPPERFMSMAAFRSFLIEVQMSNDHEIEMFVNAAYELKPPYIDKTYGLTDLGFNHLIVGKTNDIFDPQKQMLDPSSLTYSLKDYWIASSHNTYLTRGQMVGRSAVGQYIEVLLSGCRCVELDCWDGPDGEPVIYHGFTLTSKIPFEAAIEACVDYGFKMSAYPIILSLEMHCSARQKAKIGEILLRLLKSRLIYPNVCEVVPEYFKGMFLIKAKARTASGQEEEEGTEDDIQLQEKLMEEELELEYPFEFCEDMAEQKILWKAPLSDKNFILDQISPITSTASSNQSYAKSADDAELNDYYAMITLAGKKLASFSEPSRHGETQE